MPSIHTRTRTIVRYIRGRKIVVKQQIVTRRG